MSLTNEEIENIQNPEYTGYTHLNTLRFNYTWNIKDYLGSANKSYDSPIFSPGYIGNMKLCLQLIIRSNYVNLYLLPSSMPEITFIKCDFSITDTQGQSLHNSVESSKQCKPLSDGKCTLLDFYCEKLLIIRRAIALVCDIEIHIITSSYPGDSHVIELPKCELKDNLRHLLEAQDFSDVTINVCGQELTAHKAILSARSPVFSAMFKNEMTEKLQNRVNITDVEFEVFGEMLRYIYTDKVLNIETMADKLLVAAEKYELGRLKVMCEKVLRAKLTPENVVDTLILAHLNHADRLKEMAIQVMTAHWRELIETASFQSMFDSYPLLIADVLRGPAKYCVFYQYPSINIAKTSSSIEVTDMS